MYSRRLKKSLFSPAQPRRAETRLSPGDVLASFRPSTYKRRFSEVGVAVGVFPFAKTYSMGERRILVRRGWAGEKSGLFEPPAQSAGRLHYGQSHRAIGAGAGSAAQRHGCGENPVARSVGGH